MKITLMRHGKPLLPAVRWMAPFEMERWIEFYNRSEVASTCVPQASTKAANSDSVILASTAPRALSSVRALGHKASVIDAFFSEAALPFFFGDFLTCRLAFGP